MTMVWREIVSRVIHTAAGSEVWLEMDSGQHLTVRCAGCRLNEFTPAMAPGLVRLREHADTCDR